jgi:hypothetical protein
MLKPGSTIAPALAAAALVTNMRRLILLIDVSSFGLGSE